MDCINHPIWKVSSTFLLYIRQSDINYPHLEYFHTIVKSSIIGLFEGLKKYPFLESEPT